MRPAYGCYLWDYLMEPWTPVLTQKIINEATRICSLDSRCVLVNVQVYQLDYGFRIEVSLSYQPWNVIGTFTASFELADANYYGYNNSGTVSGPTAPTTYYLGNS